MNRRVWVTDAEAVTALGGSREEIWRALLRAQSAIAPVTRFDASRYHSQVAACLPDLRSAGDRSLLEPLLDRLFGNFGPVPSDAALVTATTKGCIDILEKTRRLGRPVSEQAMIGAVAEMARRRAGIVSPGINISAACASATIAIGHAAALVAHGVYQAALVLGVDIVSEFVFSGFSALQALDAVPCRPFDRERRGLSLGEGAAAVLLMEERRARREKRRHLGTILGWGSANDANHITAPARDGCGLVMAEKSALAMSGGDVAGVSAHGTGTVYNDLMELAAYRAVFGSRRMPVYSVKGAVGHALGAAGGIEAVLALAALRDGSAPPTAGFRHPEKGAEKLISPQAQSLDGDRLLLTNSGFGGINAALVLGRGEWS